jgi:hypothetical protein
VEENRRRAKRKRRKGRRGRRRMRAEEIGLEEIGGRGRRRMREEIGGRLGEKGGRGEGGGGE